MNPSRRPTVLLIEDGATDAFLIQLAIGRCGADLHLAHLLDAHAAMAYLEGRGPYGDRQRHPMPDLLVLDIHLPRMSGLDFLAWIRQHTDHHALPVVMFTASLDPRDRLRAHELGARDFLEKPSGMPELVALVGKLNSMSRGGRPAERPAPLPAAANHG